MLTYKHNGKAKMELNGIRYKKPRICEDGLIRQITELHSNRLYSEKYQKTERGHEILKRNNIIRRDRMLINGDIKNGEDANVKINIKIINEKFNNKCYNCGMTQEEHKKLYNERLNFDHFNPLIKNFKMTENNCVLLCKKCNGIKGTKNPEEFFTKMQIEDLNKKYDVHT